jgi:DNA-binding NarL/FixJ family response regulator
VKRNGRGLTLTQRKMYDMLITAMTYPEIEKASGLAKSTVSLHSNSVMAELGYSSRIDLICDYYEGSDVHEQRDCAFIYNLTESQHTVFTLTLKGYKVAEIGEMLTLSAYHVRYTRHQVFFAANVSSAIELVHKCYGVK